MGKWFRGIRFKLMLINFLSLIVLLFVGLSGFRTVSALSEKLNTAYNVRAPLGESLGEIQSGVHASFRWLWASYATDKNMDDKKKFIFLARSEVIKIDHAIEKYLSLPIVPKARKVFTEKFEPNWKKSKIIIEKIIKELEDGKLESSERAKEIMGHELRSSFVPLGEVLVELRETVKNVNASIVKESLDYADEAKKSVLFVMLIGSILGLGISLFIANSLAKKLSTLSSELKNASDCVSSAAQQIAASSEQLSAASIEQASSLEETSSSVYEMSSTVNKNAENVNTVSSNSEISQSSAHKGKEAVQNMIVAIADIAKSNELIMNQVNQGNREISEIVKVISEIGDKTKVINDIVFQTKLLSFNASVEAARAGENGKGFAVVAEEIGNLAHMSGSAAREISQLLDSSIVKVDSIVNQTKAKVENLICDGKTKIEQGIDVAHGCGAMLDEVVHSISSVTVMARDISQSTKDQAQGVSEITRAIAQINVATQQNSAGASQSAAAAEELSAQASMLKNAIGVLVETVDGQSQRVS